MTHSELPVGNNPLPLEFPHFPTKYQTVLWRNWGLVPPERIAVILQTTLDIVFKVADDLGLRVPPDVNEDWLFRGYITIIRANWHLLPYEQLLDLLGFTAAQLEKTLRDDDFLWIKLGSHKPKCCPVFFYSINSEQEERTRTIKSQVEKYFPHRMTIPPEQPFAFVKRFNNQENTFPPIINKSFFELRIIYSYLASTGDVLLNLEKTDPYPEGLLQKYAQSGINGVWLGVILYQLFPFPVAKELSDGYEKRLKNLKLLTERAAKYGIGIFLYLNEPRGLPLKYYENYPEYKGAEREYRGVYAMCTSSHIVQKYLHESCAFVFQNIPLLAGAITISMSENVTHCYAQAFSGVSNCPACDKRTPQEVIAEVNAVITRGIHSVKPTARILVWTWAMNPDWIDEVINLLPEGIDIMCESERELPSNIGGTSGIVYDYTMSQIGPGKRAQSIWQKAKKKDFKTAAKIQLSTTWECSAVPYIPVPYTVKKHLDNLQLEKVNSLMVSWTVGGYPGINLEMISKNPGDVIKSHFPPAAEEGISRALKQFSLAFAEYPFHFETAHRSPVNFAANLLFEKPTGYKATMIGFPYDDLTAWRQIYSEEIFENQLLLLTEKWKIGLDILKDNRQHMSVKEMNIFEDLERTAIGAFCHFRTTYLQTVFIRLRNRFDNKSKEKAKKVLLEEIRLCQEMFQLMRTDSRIGFEASNQYYYTVNDFMEKTLNCLDLIDRLYN